MAFQRACRSPKAFDLGSVAKKRRETGNDRPAASRDRRVSFARNPLSVSRDGRRGRLAGEEAFAAVHWPALGWLEGHRSFPTALRAGGHGFRFGEARGRRTLALGLATLAAFGLVLKVFVVEEVLFSRCKYEICSAINALEDAILKLRHSNCAPL